MIKRFTLHYICCLLFVLGAATNKCVALDHGLALSLVNYTIQNTQGNIDQGQTFTITATLTNDDSSEFTGVVEFGLRSGGTNLTGTPGIFGTPPFSGKQITLQGGETVPCVFNVHVDAGSFAPGPAVVVVWPICTPIYNDSIIISIHVNNPLGVEDQKASAFSYVVSNDKIQLFGMGSETDFRQVRIYSLMGQLTSQFNGRFITEIPVAPLPKGLYICEIIAADNRREVIKFVH